MKGLVNMDIYSTCRHVIHVLETFNYRFDVTWNHTARQMRWETTTTDLFFSEKDAVHFELEKHTHNRYLYYIIENIPKIERTVTEVQRIIAILEHDQKETVPYECSTRFPKAITYCGVRKKIVLNPIKLFDYIEYMKKQTVRTREELYTFVFLHEYGHHLEDKEVELAKRTKMFIKSMEKERKEGAFWEAEAKLFLLVLEQAAWERGKQFLSLFPYDLSAYENFSRIPLSSYENLPFQYLKNRHFV